MNETCRRTLCERVLRHLFYTTLFLFGRRSLFPAAVELPFLAKHLHRFAGALVDSAHALRIGGIIHGGFFADAQRTGFGHGINVGAHEDELPAVLFLRVGDELPDGGTAELAAGVFQPVGHDHEDHQLRLGTGPVFLEVAVHLQDRASHRVEQRRAAAGEVLLLGTIECQAAGRRIWHDPGGICILNAHL